MRQLVHKLTHLSTLQSGNKYEKSLADLKAAQHAVLNETINDLSKTKSGKNFSPLRNYRRFQSELPITSYSDWEELIKKQVKGEQNLIANKCQYFEPTSGSTHKAKYIPYTKLFLRQLDRAISPWLSDLYSNYPEITKGTHYWSTSWLPTKMRETHNVDDKRLLTNIKSGLLSRIMCVPDGVSTAPSSNDSLKATLTYLLANSSLSLLSVWSPTYLLSLLNNLQKYRSQIEIILRSGNWGDWGNELNYLPCPQSKKNADIIRSWNGKLNHTFLSQIWPKLTLISCWDTSTSAYWVPHLKALFPNTQFQGKGLWATEGAVTIPYRGKYPLAVNSHFYEFQCLDTKKVLPSWELQIDQRVQPVLTTSSGLLRYILNDEVRVVDFLKQTPCLEFIGRICETDMVGEKIASSTAKQIFIEIKQQKGDEPVTLFAVSENEKRYYALLVDGTDKNNNLAHFTEEKLSNYFHYNLARELNQLSECKVIYSKNPANDYFELINKSSNNLLGSTKIEVLKLINL